VLAQTIESNWKPGAVIEDNGDYEAASSVNYYTRHQLRILNGRCNNIWYGSKFPDAPQIFDDDVSFEKLWHSGQTVFLLTDEKASSETKLTKECPQREHLPDYVAREGACVLAKWGGKLVLTNGPKPCRGQTWLR
jgi:hypothetical protein